jgi:Domain of unknown function (DUF5069)
MNHPASLPPGPLEETDGLKYFPRLTAKIRLHAAGRLWDDLHANLGKGLDATFCSFLRLDYEALRARVLDGGSDQEVLAWCAASTRPLTDTDRLLWNHYVSKLGWRDQVTAVLERRKAESGLTSRTDIETIAQYIDADEGRA